MLGLPSLHTLDHAQGARIWFAAEATDMRCGFDRLAERVRAVIGQDPLSGHLFVFRSRRGDRLKILWFCTTIWTNAHSTRLSGKRRIRSWWLPNAVPSAADSSC